METLAQGQWLSLHRSGGYEFCSRNGIAGIVAIVAITDDDELVIVEQERPPVGATVVEIPAGLAGDHHAEESLEAAARRELLEETGFHADRWERITETPPSPGMTSEMLTFFRATGLRRAGPGGGDDDEEIIVHLVPRVGVEAWLEERRRAGLLIDMKLYAGLYFADA